MSPTTPTPDRSEIEMLRDAVSTFSRLHERALTAMSETIRVAGETGDAHQALEYLGDWMNDCDAVDDADVANYERYLAKRAASEGAS